MKILAVSFLRLGDLALAARAIRALRVRHPDADLCLAAHRACASAVPLLPYINRCYLLDRDDLQAGLGDAHRPMFDSYDILKGYVDGLAAERFDLAVNFSHTRFSGWILGLARPHRTIGLCINEFGLAEIESPWFKMLNEQAGRVTAGALHDGEIFARAVGENRASLPPGLIETDRGRREATVALTPSDGRPWIAVQCLTSDSKKNWGLDRFEAAIEIAAEAKPAVRFAILGAEFERKQLEPLVVRLRRAGVDARLTICSVEGLLSIVKRCRLLLTGDTVTKHFASDAGIPCVEVSIGSSDWRRTGAWSTNSVILQGNVPCAPCPHSVSCSQPTHACAIDLQPASVAHAVITTFERVETLSPSRRDEALGEATI